LTGISVIQEKVFKACTVRAFIFLPQNQTALLTGHG